MATPSSALQDDRSPGGGDENQPHEEAAPKWRATLWFERIMAGSAALRLMGGGKLRASGAIVLAYHDICSSDAGDQYCVPPAKMRAELELALGAGLRFVKLSVLTDALIQGEPVDGLAAIVFDDSLVGVHHNAMPILLDMGLPATVYTVTGVLGQDPPWWPGSARVMTAAELASMSHAGFEIACHTHSHPALPGLSHAALARELHAPRALLEDLAGAAVDLFAYPFGAHDRRVRAAVAEAGYRAGFTFLNGRITPGLDRYRLPRLNMTGDRGIGRFAYHLARPPASWPDTQLEHTNQHSVA